MSTLTPEAEAAFRLDCLKLALMADVAQDDERVIARARAFADFVIDEEGGRDA